VVDDEGLLAQQLNQPVREFQVDFDQQKFHRGRPMAIHFDSYQRLLQKRWRPIWFKSLNFRVFTYGCCDAAKAR